MPTISRFARPSLFMLGLLMTVGFLGSVGCSKPVAEQKVTPENKEEIQAKLKEIAEREQQGL